MDSFNWQRFQAFEYKHKLFEIQNREGIFIWDVIRYDIFVLIRNSGAKIPDAVNVAKSNIRRKLEAFWRLMQLIGVLAVGKKTFLLLTASRNGIAGNKFYDQIIDDVLKRLRNESLILEIFEPDKNKLYYPEAVIIYKNPICALLSKFYKHHDYSGLIELIQNEFGYLSEINSGVINRIVNNYKAELGFYKLLLKRQKIKGIFIVQPGAQKGLFKAAKTLNIPVTELQHALIDKAHVTYNYNPSINYPEESINLPDYFFTFSDYWVRSLYYPVKEIIQVGNTAFYRSSVFKEKGEDNKGILVASANIYGEALKDLILEYVALNRDVPVYFKLHPNQWSEGHYYSSQFASFKNISVITNEYSIGDLLEKVQAIVVVKSTAIYEALQAQRVGIVFSSYDAFEEDEMAGLPNVHFVSNGLELTRVIQQSSGKTEKYKDGYFFKPFNETMFTDFLRRKNLSSESAK
jgi:hypothetical protein